MVGPQIVVTFYQPRLSSMQLRVPKRSVCYPSCNCETLPFICATTSDGPGAHTRCRPPLLDHRRPSPQTSGRRHGSGAANCTPRPDRRGITGTQLGRSVRPLYSGCCGPAITTVILQKSAFSDICSAKNETTINKEPLPSLPPSVLQTAPWCSTSLHSRLR